MDFNVPEDTRLLVDSYTKWVHEELLPLEAKHGITMDAGLPADVARYVRTKSAELGFYTHHMPEEVGGGGLTMLDSVVAILRASPNLRVDVQGHTDYRGSAAHNLDLSNRRAAAVRRYLMAHDIVEERLDSHGFGNTCPARAGTNAAARRANRHM